MGQLFERSAPDRSPSRARGGASRQIGERSVILGWPEEWAEDWSDEHTVETEYFEELSCPSLAPRAPTRRTQRARQQLQALVAAIAQLGLHVVHADDSARLLIPSDTLFEPASSKLTSPGELAIDSLARAFVSYPSLRIQVEDHTDGSPPPQPVRSLWHLGFERAIAVRARLLGGGVARARVRGLTYAGTRPLHSNESEAGRANNRRIELLVQGST